MEGMQFPSKYLLSKLKRKPKTNWQKDFAKVVFARAKQKSKSVI
jgi:hypothetical protein